MKKIVYLALFTLLIYGCKISKTVLTQFYLVEYPYGAEKMLSDSIFPIPINIELQNIDINPSFASNEIAIREESHKIQYFTQHKWAVRPDQALVRFVISFYESNRYFQNVDTRLWKEVPDYKLNISIYRLEVVHLKKNMYAQMHFKISLQRSDNDQIVIEHLVNRKEQLKRKDLNLFAESICMIFNEELTTFSEKVAHNFAPKK
jgi:ABC-type uncharacterized transport system auxiliary subunit